MYKLLYVCLLLSFASSEDVTEQVFGSVTKFSPAAFADFNSDKHTDILVINNTKSSNECSVRVMLAYIDPPLIRPSGPECPCPGGGIIKSVVPGDFDGDGALDVLMLNVQNGEYDVYMAWGNLTHLKCPTDKFLSLHSEPLVMDYNGDMIADLFGEDVNRTRSFFVFDNKRNTPKQIPMLDERHSDKTKFPNLRLPSSHAFVDLDQDLGADLFVTADRQFEIWKNTAAGFDLYETIKIPDEFVFIGQTAFMDVRLSGKIEPLTVLCTKTDCSDGQIYVWTEDAKSNQKKFLPLGPSLKLNKNSYRYPSDERSNIYTTTVTLRVADHDLDGYPDLLVTLLDSSGNPQIFLAHNRPCKEDTCSYPRKFVLVTDLFSDFPKSVMATFFDVFEDGRVDILLMHEDSQNKGNYIAAAVRDQQYYDAMFLKVLVPSGSCYGATCANGNIPYGTSPAGPTIRYSITTGEKSIQTSMSTQLCQSAHMALQLPYTLFGLGRNWNFVETLDVGLPFKLAHVYSKNDSMLPSTKDGEIIVPNEFPTVRTFSQIVPNSQVIVIPYPPDRPAHWVNKLYLTPSKALKLTAAALVGVCTLVACVIGVLHFKERREDKKEKLQQAQTFHFDAM